MTRSGEWPQWTLITSHALVLLGVDQRPQATVRQLADAVGITERQVYRILNDLEDEGYITREKAGRRNHYTVHRVRPAPYLPTIAREVGELLALLTG